MRRFLVGLFAVVGFLFILAIAAAIGAAYWFSGHSTPDARVPDKAVLIVDLREAFFEAEGFSPLELFEDGASMSVSDLVLTLDAAAADDRIEGLFVRIAETDHGFARAQEMIAALERFRESGKPTVGWADTIGEIGSGNEGYMIASALGEIYVQPGGMVGLTGLSVEMPFARDLLDRIGVEPAVVRRAEYKTMLDNVTHSGFSDAHREMMETILDSLFSQLIGTIARNRLIPLETIPALVDRGPFTADQALEAELIDGIEYRHPTFQLFMEKFDEPEILDLSEYADMLETESEEDGNDSEGIQIALLRTEGEVVRGDEDLSENIAGDTLAESIRDAVDDEDVAAIVLRLDTGGGSAIASETIAHEIRNALAEDKPVIVSMGNLAASGGYWIAMGASRIVAQPGTLTGSIGVIAAKPVIAGLSATLGVNWERIDRGTNSDLFAMGEPFDAAGSKAMNAMLDDIYDRFVTGVSEGRNLDEDFVHEIARGRVWTGEEALEIGLVDRLGGLPDAIDEARLALGLEDAKALRIVPWPRPMSSLERLQMLLDDQLGRFGEFVLFWNRLKASVGTVRMPYFNIR
ncbi:MAG: signal peptide peptidase SppA [Geminicoccaceae bacterium]|nr:signal peptide peptidase SppA [Geminicoccaceae bacterium]